LEALLLANMSNDGVAKRLKTTPGVIEAYESLFFNVRDARPHTDYVMHSVLESSTSRSAQSKEHDSLLKMYAFLMGPHAFAAMATGFNAPTWCGSPDEVSSAINMDAISGLKVKAALAAKSVQVNQKTALALLDQFTKFVAVERTTDDSGPGENPLIENLSKMFSALPLTVGGRDPHAGHARVENPAIARLERHGAMLRHDEAILVQAGHKLPYEDELLTMQYPDTEDQQEATQEGD